MKKTILILMGLFMLPVVFGAICEDRLAPGDTCTMLTPTLTSCSVFNYTIFNTSGATVIYNDTLILLNDTVFQFEFNLSEGDYVVQLCSGDTREIRVSNDPLPGSGGGTAVSLTQIAIVLGLVTFILLFIWTIFQIPEDEKDSRKGLNIKLILSIVIMSFAWVLYAYLLKIVDTAQEVVLLAGYRVMVSTFVVIITLILLFLLWQLIILLANIHKTKL